MPKNTPLTFALIILLSLIVVNYVLIGLSNKSWAKLQEENTAIDLELIDCRTSLSVYGKYHNYDVVRTLIGRRLWSEDNDCYVHSQDLVNELAKLDIMSVVLVNENRDHAWVCPYVESVGGNFIGLDNNLRIIEIRDKDRNVLCECK